MTRPTVSPTGEELYDHLRAISKDDEATDWTTLLVADSLVAPGLDPVVQLSRDSDDAPGWSALLDLNRCPGPLLPWLAQFVGVVTNSNDDNANRDLILNRPSWKRGRPDSLIAAVQATLTGAQTVRMYERDTSPYHTTIQTFASQTPNAAATRAAIAAAKPALIIVTLQVLTGPTYADTKTAAGGSGATYASRETRFPTYGDIQEYTP